jgi:hypothetical protein
MNIVIDGCTFTGKQMLWLVLKSLAITGAWLLFLQTFFWLR